MGHHAGGADPEKDEPGHEPNQDAPPLQVLPLEERAPLGRRVEVEEVGSTGLFLASNASSGITGEVIFVDCGYNIMGF